MTILYYFTFIYIYSVTVFMGVNEHRYHFFTTAAWDFNYGIPGYPL